MSVLKSTLFNEIPPPENHTSRILNRIPGIRSFNNLNIGLKLNIGFGILVLLTFFVVGLIFVASRQATQNINLTEDLRVPAALASARAQTSLLKMQAALRGYLVFGDLKNIDDYNKAKEVFEINLAELETLSADWTDANDIQHLNELKSAYEAWSPISARLFELHDNLIENRPALRLESSKFRPINATLLYQLDTLITLQEQQNLAIKNQELLADTIDLKTSFQAMATNVRAYAVTGDLAFKFGYASNLNANRLAWENLEAKQSLLTAEQQALFADITQARKELLTLPFEIFQAVEGERAYEDLYLFKTEAEPQTEKMLTLLDEMTSRQQSLLRTDLNKSKQSLIGVRLQTVVSGVLALVLGIAMAYIFKENIAGPVQRLITTAEQIAAGDLASQAGVESKDEIGRLATTINIMTYRLRRTIDSLAKHTQQLEAIVEISQRLTTKLNVDELARDVVTRIKRGFDFYHTHIYLLDADQQELTVIEGTGAASVEMKTKQHSIPLNANKNPVAQAARTGEIVLIKDVQEVQDWLPNPLLPDTRSEMAVPIIVEERVVGVLDVQEDRAAGLDERDAKVVRTLANQVAIALNNANLFEQTQKALAETEKLYHINQGMMVARNLSELIGAVVEGGNIPVINRGVLSVFEYNKYGDVEAMEVIANWYRGQAPRPSPSGTRYLRAVNSVIDLFLSQEPLFFTDAQQDERIDPATKDVVCRLRVRAMAALPLWTQARQIGVLLLQGNEPYNFTRREIRAYLSLLGQLTVAVENQRLFEQTQQRAAELAKAKEAAEMASRAKSEFLASMSHELRTPLNGILGYTQILNRDEQLDATQKNAVKIIQDCGEHLLTLINDILDLAKIEANKLELHFTDFKLSRFLEGIVGMFNIRAQQEGGVAFTYKPLTALPPIVRADEKRLRQILINLLSNAIKFTDTGEVTFYVGLVKNQDQSVTNAPQYLNSMPGRNNLQGEFKASRIRFEVVDTGIGISSEQLDRIFLPFEQVGEPGHRADGTGLGLAITKNLVEAMDGTLQVKSEPGKGSTFAVEVEMSMLWTTPEYQQPLDHDIVGYLGPQRKVLVVDDKPNNRSVLVDLLKPLGFEVMEAEDGLEGVDLSRTTQPDVILMDLIMPKMNGFEAIRAMREIPALQNAIIIATSANAFDKDELQSLEAGCDAFLVKPIKAKNLFDLLEAHLSLIWVDKKTQATDDTQDMKPDLDEQELIPPPPEEMAFLFDLAMKGEIRRLKRRVAYIEQLDEKFKPFARKLDQLVDKYDEDQILALIQKHID